MLDDVADYLDEMKEAEQDKTSFGSLLDRSWAIRKGILAPEKENHGDEPIEDAVAVAAPADTTNGITKVQKEEEKVDNTPEVAVETTGSDGAAGAAGGADAQDKAINGISIIEGSAPEVIKPEVNGEEDVGVAAAVPVVSEVEMLDVALPEKSEEAVASPPPPITEGKPDHDEVEKPESSPVLLDSTLKAQPETTAAAAVGVEEDENTAAVAAAAVGGPGAVKEEDHETGAALLIKADAAPEENANEGSKQENKEEGDQQELQVLSSILVEDAGPAVAADDPEKVPLPSELTDTHLQFLNWHWANLEYGCSAPLSALSAKNWNQDEDFGGFGGPHCMVVGGYDQAFRKIASLLDVRLGTPAASVKMHEGVDRVEVITSTGESLWCDAVVVTVPLGVLKSNGLVFDPPLPQWKQECIERLGFGDLNKVVLEFPEVFWDDSVDFFGAAKGLVPEDRGFCFMWWNFHRFAGAPILAALVSGESAHAAESASDEELKTRAVEILKAMHPGVNVPEPVACTVSRWASELYSKGSYSYVAVGASGDDYDRLSIPVLRRILFAGEHTIKEHPDTVGGAMLSGIREAARALEILEIDNREGAQGAAAVGQAVAELKRKHAASNDREVPLNKKSRNNVGDKKKSGGKKRKAEERNGLDGSQGSGRMDFEKEGEEDADEEEDEDEDADDLDRKFGGVMGRDVGRMREELRARQTAREATKEVWRCLMIAESGDILPILELLQTSTDLHSRHTVSNCLASASIKALEALGSDPRCLAELSNWVSEAAAASVQVALLDQILKALRAMPLEGSLAKESGLAAVVKQCTMHGDPDVRKLAGNLTRSWMASENNAVGHGARGGKGRPGSSNGHHAASAMGGGNGHHHAAGGAQGAMEGGIATGAAAPVVPMKIELDEQAKRELEEAEAEMRRKEELAAALAAEAAAAEEQAKAEREKTGGGAGIGSFYDYKKSQKESKKQSKKSKERRSGGGGDEGHGDGKEESFDFVKKVKALIGYVLTQHVQSGKLKKDQYKMIIDKASEKVLSKVTPEELARGRPAYEKRKDNIKKLAEDYANFYSNR